MTGKRFENRLNKSDIKFNTLNPVWDNERGTALNVFEMIEEMNKLEDEKIHFKNGRSSWKITASEEICKHGETIKKLAKVKEENEQLKTLIKKTLETTPIEHNLAVELKNSVRELYD